MVCSFFEIGMSFLPPKTIRRLFPPIVSGTTILLIGCSVISTALKDWAGGSGTIQYVDIIIEIINLQSKKVLALPCLQPVYILSAPALMPHILFHGEVQSFWALVSLCLLPLFLLKTLARLS
jgi:xanthine/uracil permease